MGLKDGRNLDADMVIYGIGDEVNSKFLKFEEIDNRDGGILVDN